VFPMHRDGKLQLEASMEGENVTLYPEANKADIDEEGVNERVADMVDDP